MYTWCESNLINEFDYIEWARDNYYNYDGEYSFLWHPVVIEEFKRIKKQDDAFHEQWAKMWADIGETYHFDYFLVAA